jgi:hypothetical protein
MRYSLDECRALRPPVDAFHLLDHHKPLRRCSGQTHARPIRSVGSRDGTGNKQAGQTIELLLGQNKSGPVPRLLTADLWFEADPSNIAATWKVRVRWHLPDFLAHGFPPTDLAWLIVWSEALEHILERRTPRSTRLDHETSLLDPEIDLRTRSQAKLLQQWLRQTKANTIAPAMESDRHGLGPWPLRWIYIRYPKGCLQRC